MYDETPYEYYNDTLGVEARYLFSGRNAHEDSLQVIGDRGLRMRIERGAIIKLRSQGPGQPMLLKWDSLPAKWRELMIRSFGNPPQMLRQTVFEQHFKRDTAAFDYFSLFRFPDNSPLDDAKVEEYTMNASVLNTMNEVYARRHSYRKLLKGGTLSTWEILCGEVERFRAKQTFSLPQYPKKLRAVLNEYKRSGYSVLISKKFGNINSRKVTPEVKHFIDCLFADFRHKPNKQEVARQYEGFLDGYVQVINNETGELYTPGDFPRLSISTVTSYVSKWENAIATESLRSGNRQTLMQKFKPYHSLLQPKHAGSIISIDDRQPPFEYAPKQRMWFYNGIDLGSEAFVCWVYGKTKEGIILDFYRQLVRNFAAWGLNLPAELEAELSLNGSFKNTFLREGNMFQYVTIEPNNARGKRIEAYYNPLRYAYEKKREGWLARPFARNEANQSGPKEVPLIPYNQLVQECLRDIETWNNAEHSAIKGKSRWEVFLETQNPNLRPTNYRGIIPYLGYQTKSSCNAGIIKLQRREFLLGNGGTIALGKSLIDLMTLVEGREVTLYWLDDNRGDILKAYVYVGNEFVCEAVQKPAYNRARIERTAEDIANQQLMCSYVETIEAYRRRRIKEIDRVMVIDNIPRTLNNTFRIDNLARYEANDTPPEILPAISDFEMPLETSRKDTGTSLRDRF